MSALTSWATSATTPLMSRGLCSSSPFLTRTRTRRITSAARVSSATMSFMISRSSAMFGASASRSFCATSALLRIAVNGWFSSCASDAGSSPRAETPPMWGSARPMGAVGKALLHWLALQGAGKGLAQEVEPIDQLIGPGVLSAHRVQGQDAEHRSARAQRNRQVRACPEAVVADAIDRGLLRELGAAAESNDAAATKGVHGPGEMLGRQDRRELDDAWSGARHADAGRVIHVLVQVAPIHAEDVDHPPQRGLQRRVDTAGLDVNQLRRQLRQQCLEPQAVFKETLRAPARRRGDKAHTTDTAGAGAARNSGIAAIA